MKNKCGVVWRKDFCLLISTFICGARGDPALAAAAASKEEKRVCGRNVFRANSFFLSPDILLQVEDVGRHTFRIKPEGRRGHEEVRGWDRETLRSQGGGCRLGMSLAPALLWVLQRGNEAVKPSLLCSPLSAMESHGGAHLCPCRPTGAAALSLRFLCGNWG